MGKRAWIYVRVSSEEQTKGYSLESQESRCRDYAAQQDYTVVGVAQDVDPGEQLDRAGLMRAIDVAANDPYDVLVVYDLDRFSRGGPPHCAILEMQLERRGVVVEFVLGNFNGNSPEAVVSKYFKQSMSWYENQQRRERVTRGRLSAAKHGKTLTGARPPYGYSYSDGKLFIDPEEAEVVHRIFRELLDGASARQIAERLSADCVLTRADKVPHLAKRNAAGVWNRSSVLKIIKNPVYTGVWHYNKRHFTKVDGKPVAVKRPPAQWIAVPVAALIDSATFERAQAQLESNRTLAKRNTQYQYLLQYLVHCTCGARCLCETDSRHDLRSYQCPNRRRAAWATYCPTRFTIKADTLEAAVWRLVVEMLLDPAYLQAWFATQRANASEERRQIEDRLAAITASIKQSEHKLGALLDQALTHDFPRSVVEERRRLLSEQHRRLEQEERRTQAALASLSLSPEHEQELLQMAHRVRQGIDQLDFAARRRVLELLQIQVTVIERRRVSLSALLPLRGGGGMPADDHPGVGFLLEIDLTTGAVRAVSDGHTAQGGAA